jgi:hypothetical protein
MAIEDQMTVHYAMPLRNRLYDDLSYITQVKKLSEKRRNAQNTEKLSPAEFLSGMKKTDRLLPCLTITVYLGVEEWDGPLQLSDMVAIPEEIMPLFQDYSMHFISARDDDWSVYSNDDVNKLFHILNLLYQEKTEELMASDFCVSEDTYHVLQSLPGTAAQLKDMEQKSEGGIKMYPALETLRNEGIAKGREQMLLELVSKNMLTSSNAAQILQITEEEFLQKYKCSENQDKN